jgi:hypothetical protein
MLAAMEQGEREMVPSVEAVALETAKRLPSETDKLLASVQSGDERRATVRHDAHHRTRTRTKSYLFVYLRFLTFHVVNDRAR